MGDRKGTDVRGKWKALPRALCRGCACSGAFGLIGKAFSGATQLTFGRACSRSTMLECDSALRSLNRSL